MTLNVSLSSFVPFLTSLNGISCFADLDEKLRSLRLSDPGSINIIFVSFYRELIQSFTRYAEVHFSKKNSNNVILVQERHLFKNKKSLEARIEGRREILVFDSVSTTETLALIIRALERGHEIHVFNPWTFSGSEKRAALSILIRNCANDSFSISRSEFEMWNNYITHRLKSMEVIQSVEFT